MDAGAPKPPPKAGGARTEGKVLRDLVAQMLQERQSWDGIWRDVADFCLPRVPRFLASDTNRGDRRSSRIYNPTATLAGKRLASGMMSGLTSPSRPWFLLTHHDPYLAEDPQVAAWLSWVTERMRAVLLGSNLYTELPICYRDQAFFGTSAVLALEDDEQVIRFQALPIGSYALGQDARRRVNTLARCFALQVGQIVDRWGLDVVSPAVRAAWDKGETQAWIEITHVLRPNPDYRPRALGAKFARWQSVYFETGCNEEKSLETSGFHAFPVLAPRWELTGDDIYGQSPGMDTINLNKLLQSVERRTIQTLDQMADPALVGPPRATGEAPVSSMPGSYNTETVETGRQGVRALREVRPPFGELGGMLDRIEGKLGKFFHADLMLSVQLAERGQVTATEIARRYEENLQFLGPTLDRQNDDLLGPLVDREFAIMLGRGMLPPPPPQLEGEVLKVEYISIMAQAQRAAGIGSMDRFFGSVEALAKVNPDVLDKIDFDQGVDEYAKATGAPPRVVRGDEAVAAIRQRRAEQQQAMQAAEAAKSLARAGRDASQIDPERLGALGAAIGGAR